MPAGCDGAEKRSQRGDGAGLEDITGRGERTPRGARVQGRGGSDLRLSTEDESYSFCSSSVSGCRTDANAFESVEKAPASRCTAEILKERTCMHAIFSSISTNFPPTAKPKPAATQRTVGVQTRRRGACEALVVLPALTLLQRDNQLLALRPRRRLGLRKPPEHRQRADRRQVLRRQLLPVQRLRLRLRWLLLARARTERPSNPRALARARGWLTSMLTRG